MGLGRGRRRRGAEDCRGGQHGAQSAAHLHEGGTCASARLNVPKNCRSSAKTRLVWIGPNFTSSLTTHSPSFSAPTCNRPQAAITPFCPFTQLALNLPAQLPHLA